MRAINALAAADPLPEPLPPDYLPRFRMPDKWTAVKNIHHPSSPQALAAALKQLALDSALRRRLGERGRAHVAAKYDWPACVDRMAQVYRRVSGWQ